MRTLLAVVALALSAADFSDDAPLFAVTFADAQEGWACGADGVVLHTIDGGESWERQPTGTRATLRGLHFLTPYTGWIVGREELPGGSGAGVLLSTRDGGLSWERSARLPLPGLHAVRFFDERTGVVAGEGTDEYPSGLFATQDGGRTWKPVSGERRGAVSAADFRSPDHGILAGAWGRLDTVRGARIARADVDALNHRTVRSVRLGERYGLAVGDAGLALINRDGSGSAWGYLDFGLPPELMECVDFRGVSVVGDWAWLVGRPGSVVWFSPDRGSSWRPMPTGQSIPLNAIHFTDRLRGWAVGELGTILSTDDAGRTWTPRRRGGQRAAVLFLNAAASGTPFDVIARLGGHDGYLATAIQVTRADPESAPVVRSADEPRTVGVTRHLGGAAAEIWDGFARPRHLDGLDRSALLRSWERFADRPTDQLTRELILAIRVWQPAVVVTDAASGPAEELVREAVRAAFIRAADPSAERDQVTKLHLGPWSALKLYAPGRGDLATLSVVTTEAAPVFGDTPRDAAIAAAARLSEAWPEPPARREFELLASAQPDAAGHRDLMDGTDLAPGGTGRRASSKLPAGSPADLERQVREKRNFDAIARSTFSAGTDPGVVLAQAGPMLDKLTPDQGADAVFQLANRYARSGRWVLAREAYLLLADRYPAHPNALEAYRWLIAYHASGEARRRHELGQFVAHTRIDFRPDPNAPTRDNPFRDGRPRQELVEKTSDRRVSLLNDSSGARRWLEGSLAVESRLAGFGPRFVTDPSVQFALQSVHRQLGNVDTPKAWFRAFVASRPADAPDPWREAAAAELWLAERSGSAPKPFITCRQAPVRPKLDGVLDDDCWAGDSPVTLRGPGRAAEPGSETRIHLAYDREFLYVAAECPHPARPPAEPAIRRGPDADLAARDRIEILIDIDRDYRTYYRLRVDESGAVADDCWGDHNWNPKWYVARRGTETGYTIEAAIPLAELSGDPISLGRAWAANFVRIIPGQGVRAMAFPADAEPRPEGLGLMLFTAR